MWAGHVHRRHVCKRLADQTSQSLHQTRQTHAHVDGLVRVQHGSQREAMMGKPSMMMTPRLMQEPDHAASLPYPSNVKLALAVALCPSRARGVPRVLCH